MGERENEAPTVEEAVDDIKAALAQIQRAGVLSVTTATHVLGRSASLLTTLQAERDAALRLVKMSVKAQAVEREHVARIAAEAERDALRTRVERLEGALEEAETCMTMVEPRSDKAEYLRILGVVRSALSQEGQG